jgi:type IV pilus assembly protein PilE
MFNGTSRNTSGFSLFELLITVAVIGIVSAIAVPAYRSYIETANMAKVTANFEEAVRLARNTFAKDSTRVTIGLAASAPGDTEGWITMFNRTGVAAPGGGPAYIPSDNNEESGRGDRVTGAIGVRWNSSKTRRGKTKPARLELWRPLYAGLVEQRARVSTDDIEIEILRKP